MQLTRDLFAIAKFLFYASMSVFDQTHQSQCLVQDERFRGVDCDIFAHNKPPTMALSTLVVIEMLNALNR